MSEGKTYVADGLVVGILDVVGYVDGFIDGFEDGCKEGIEEGIIKAVLVQISSRL